MKPRSAAQEAAAAAVDRWKNQLGSTERSLASLANVSPSTISKIYKREPGYRLKDKTYNRVADVVAQEEQRRMAYVSIPVVALCHGGAISCDETTKQTVESVVRQQLCELLTGNRPALPEGITGALIQLGPRAAGMYLVVVSPGANEEERLALAHELDHIKNRLLEDRLIDKASRPRRSSL